MSAAEPDTRTHVLYIRDGEVWANETLPGLWVVSWYPSRRDHPDYPGSTIDSQHETTMPVKYGPDAILEWASARFEGRDPRELVEVSLDEHATGAEVEEIEQIFDEAGTPAIVRASIRRRAAIELPWIVYVALPVAITLATFLRAFAAGFGDETGRDAWRGLKALITRTSEVRRGASDRDGVIELEHGSQTIILTDRIPDEGLRQVADGELPDGGYFVWDAESESWKRH
jgi:hypothetical protein